MAKSTAGGGGIGLQLCRSAAELREKFATVKRLGEANFKEGGIYLEKFVELARHVEVQIFGDGRGQVVALGERDCSIQRRNQKVKCQREHRREGQDQQRHPNTTMNAFFLKKSHHGVKYHGKQEDDREKQEDGFQCPHQERCRDQQNYQPKPTL
jgi:acetyl/propionyl-CoA carboxylase alpha subunit